MKKVLTVTMDGISVQTLHGIDISMSYGLNYLCLCYFSFQRETSLFLECGWQTHTLFYREVSLCLGLKPFLFHQLSWWFFFTQVLKKKHHTSYEVQCFFGGEYRDRTGDLLHAMQALSQLS